MAVFGEWRTDRFNTYWEEIKGTSGTGIFKSMTEKESKVVRISNNVARKLRHYRKPGEKRVAWNTLIRRAMKGTGESQWRQ